MHALALRMATRTRRWSDRVLHLVACHLADYGTDLSDDDVVPNSDAEALARPQQGSSVEITVGNRESESDPPFSRFWGDHFPIPDSRLGSDWPGIGKQRIPVSRLGRDPGRESGSRGISWSGSAWRCTGTSTIRVDSDNITQAGRTRGVAAGLLLAGRSLTGLRSRSPSSCSALAS
jgi:hypothetical protein